MKKRSLIAEISVDTEWLRYSIQNERGRFWTGRGFSKDKRSALTYADPLVVARDKRRVLGDAARG
jgi:hypothetical protein